MHAAVHPYVMSSIALAAAGAVAAAPVTFERAAVEVASPLVQLTAALPPTPADIYSRLLPDTIANLEALIATQLANPAPVLQQLISDPVTSIENLPALAAQLPNFALIGGLSVVGPPAATAAAGVVSATYTLAALGSGDPAQVLQAAAATPAFLAYGLLNGGWGPDLEPTNPGLFFVAGGALSQFNYALAFPDLYVFLPGPVGAAQYVQQTAAGALAGTVMVTAAKEGAPSASLTDDPATDTPVAPKAEKRRGPLLSNAVARIDGVLDSLEERSAGPRLTKAGGTDLSNGNMAVPGAASRPGQRIRAAANEIRAELQAAAKKLGDSVRAAVGAGASGSNDATDAAE